MHIHYCRQSGILPSGPAGRAARAGLWTAFLSRSSESWFVPDAPPRLRSLSELGIWGRFPDRDYNLRACRNRRCDLRHPHEWYRGSGLTGNPGPMVSDTWPSSVEVAWGVPIISVPLPKPISQYSKFDVNVQNFLQIYILYNKCGTSEIGLEIYTATAHDAGEQKTTFRCFNFDPPSSLHKTRKCCRLTGKH